MEVVVFVSVGAVLVLVLLVVVVGVVAVVVVVVVVVVVLEVVVVEVVVLVLVALVVLYWSLSQVGSGSISSPPFVFKLFDCAVGFLVLSSYVLFQVFARSALACFVSVIIRILLFIPHSTLSGNSALSCSAVMLWRSCSLYLSLFRLPVRFWYCC